VAFRLRRQESAVKGVKRNVKRQIETALDQLRADDPPTDEAVHEIRKSFKLIRALLRLVRDDLGDSVYRRENLVFRDAGRLLGEIRDAKILVDTLDELGDKSADSVPPDGFQQARKAMAAELKAVTKRVLVDQNASVVVAEAIEPVLARLKDWTSDDDGWSALQPGLKRVYRAGRRARDRCEDQPTDEDLHEWRKQAKYLWHQLELLEPAWSVANKDLAKPAHKLNQLLGEDHDLATLWQTLDRDPLAYGGRENLEAIFSKIKSRRETLEKEALDLGRSVYSDGPADFTKRIGSCWEKWRSSKPKRARA
jgi:CHAD domain-containing protein